MKKFVKKHWHMVSIEEIDSQKVIAFLNRNHVRVCAVYYEDSATTLEFKCTDEIWSNFQTIFTVHSGKMMADFRHC